MRIYTNKVTLEDKLLPCLVCGQSVEHDGKSLRENVNWTQGIECRSWGNYGSQVHDLDGCLIFVLCDECVIRRRERMIIASHVYEGRSEDKTDVHKSRRGEHRGVGLAKEHFERWYSHFDADDNDEYTNTIRTYFKDRDGDGDAT